MALKTKKEIVDEILYEAYSGTPPDNAAISANFVLRGLNNLIAEAAVKSAYQNNAIEGVTYTDDIFYTAFKNLTLLDDIDSGLRYFVLPAQPIGLPRERSFRVYPDKSIANRGNDLFKPLPASQAKYIMNLPRSNKIYHFVEDGRMYFITKNIWFSEHPSVNMTIASGGANNLSDILNLPDDMVAGIKTVMVLNVRKMMGTMDNLPDTKQTPQPR